MKILPLEVIIRNVAAGSFSQKYGVEEGRELAKTVLEFSYIKMTVSRSDDQRRSHSGSGAGYEGAAGHCQKYAFMINDFLKDFFLKSGKLIDFKIEFGLYDGEVILADEISPDTCRPGTSAPAKRWTKRDSGRDLGGVEETYQEVLKRVRREQIDKIQEDPASVRLRRRGGKPIRRFTKRKDIEEGAHIHERKQRMADRTDG